MQPASQELNYLECDMAYASEGRTPILVKILLSIDRREDTHAALATVELAEKYHSQGVVGIDLSGNPAVGKWDAWVPALEQARSAGLKITVHAAEVCTFSTMLILANSAVRDREKEQELIVMAPKFYVFPSAAAVCML